LVLYTIGGSWSSFRAILYAENPCSRSFKISCISFVMRKPNRIVSWLFILFNDY